MNAAQRINEWYQSNNTEPDKLPFFFNGIEGLRFMGQARDYRECDDILIMSRLNAQHISKAQTNDTGKLAFVAHA